MTVREALREGAEQLRRAGCPSPRVDAEFLLGDVLGASRSHLYVDSDRELDRVEVARWQQLLRRREAREPLAYVLGEWGFRRLTLRVDPRVLIPRPETEVVVERCLELLHGLAEPEVLDVGVGSGAIALAIADEHDGARVTAFDNSAGALEVARANLAATGLDGRVRLVEHDLATGLGVSAWDLVVSNPPYVRPDEIEALEPEVRDWEPRSALVGHGLTHELAGAALAALKPGGWLVLEVACGDAASVARLLAKLGYEDVRHTRDLAGIERVVEARRPV